MDKSTLSGTTASPYRRLFLSVLAAIGALCVALQLWIYGAWALDGIHRLPATGPDTVPTRIKVALWTIQALGLVLIVWLAASLRRQWRRTRTLQPDGLLFVGALSTVWLEPIGSYFKTTFLCNSYTINVASWGPYIPGWQNPAGSHKPEPLLYGGLAYAVGVVMNTRLICAIIQWLMRHHRIHPQSITLFAIFVGFVLVICEEGVAIHNQIEAYPLTIRQLSLWGGSPFQIPLYASIWVGLLLGVISVLRLAMIEGRLSWETDIVQLGIPERCRAGLKILIIAGITNMIIIAYYLAYAIGALWADLSPQFPSYLHNNMLDS